MKYVFSIFATLSLATAMAQAPDNTKVNKRDDHKNAVTADKQSNSKEDLNLTKKIRSELNLNKDFSTYARNIKIISKDGMVTLRGPVKTSEEKSSIEAIAKRVAGDAKVENLLEVAPPK